jgi:hypothetical protein
MKKRLRLATLIAASIAIAPIAALLPVVPASATVATSAATTLQSGSSYLNRAAGSWMDGTATLSTKIAALPASGGGLYTGVRIRESADSYYVVQSRIYPAGDVQSSIRRVVTTNGKATTTVLGATKYAPAKAKVGSALSIKLQAEGSDSVKLRATVTVGDGTPLVLTATDADAGALGRAGTAAGWGYLSTSTPPISLAPVSVDSTPVSEAPPTSAPAPAPAPAPGTNPSPAPGEYPSAATTGVPEGTNLTVHEGDLTVSTPGAVIDGLEVRGLLIINAPDVVIKNSRIVGRAVNSSVGLVSNVRSGLPFTIQDSEINAAVPSPYLNGIFGSAFTALRVDISNVIDPIHVIGGNVEIRDSWLHDNDHYEQDPLWNGTPSHSDSIQIEAGKDISVVGNRLENAHNAAIQITQNTSKAPLGDLHISGNYLDNGGCTLNVARTPAPIGNFVVTDNEFGPDRKFAQCGILAPEMNRPQQSGNTWEATGTTVVQTVLK